MRPAPDDVVTPIRDGAEPALDDAEPWLSAADLELGRRRVRRRLLLVSAPAVLIVLLIAAKLLSLPLFGGQAVDAWERKDADGVRRAADGLSVVNIVEPYKAHLAAGDAAVLRSDWEGARTEFTRSLDLVGGGVDDCPVRVNLVLSIEKRGDELTGQGRADDARNLYEQASRVVADAPEGCFQSSPPQAPDAGEQLQQAKDRLGQKQDPQATPSPSPSPSSSPSDSPSPSSSPTPSPTPTDPRQRELEQRQRDAAQERAPGGPDDEDPTDADTPPPGVKQW